MFFELGQLVNSPELTTSVNTLAKEDVRNQEILEKIEFYTSRY